MQGPQSETRIRLCGELGGTVGGRPLEKALRGRLGRLLFAYLVLNRERTVTRDELVDRLWDESPPDSAATTLSSLLSRMRSGLGADVLEGRGTLRLVLPPDAWIDVEAARASVEEAQAALEKERPADSFTHAREALDLLDQTLLVGVQSSSLDEERRGLEELATQALECVAGAGARLRGSEAAEGERAARAVIERAPYRETGYRLLMEILESRGNVAEALRVYEQCRALLSEELGATPGLELRSLHQRLLSEGEQRRPAEEPPQPPLPTALVSTGRYVGREAERERILRLWNTASEGNRGIGLIAGEPGIGKTRLCGHLAAAAWDEGALVLYGRCEEELAVPYQPWVEALTQAVASTTEQQLRAYVADHGGDLGRLAPALARKLPGAAAPHDSDPETERYLLFGAVVGLLSRMSQERPVLLVLDDLHAADKPTLLLLRHLAAAPARMRLLVLASYRTSEAARAGSLLEAFADLHRHGEMEQVELSGLGQTEVASLMEAATEQELDQDQVALATEIWRETDGNPFFVTELLRHLDESSDGRFELTGPLAGHGLPRSVREVIALRVQRLHHGAIDILTLGAVIGREFDIDLLAPVGGLPEEELLDLLEAAVEAELLTEVPERPGRFSFAHALVSHTLYENLGAARRARLHRRVGEALEEHAGDAPGPLLGELARHWYAAGPADPLRALDYSRRAAAHALENLAPDEAVRWSAQALRVFGEHAGPNDTLRCDLLIELGEAQRLAGTPGRRKTLLEAAAVARRLGDPDRLFRAAVANDRGLQAFFAGADDERAEVFEAALAALPETDAQRRAQLLALLAAERTWHPDVEGRRRLAHKSIELARAAGDPRTLAMALQTTYLPLWEPETVELRRRHAAEGLEIAVRLGAPRIRWWAVYQEQIAAFEAGDVAAFERGLGEMRRVAEEIGEPTLNWLTDRTEASLLSLRGDLEAAEALAQRAAESGVRDSLPLHVAQLGTIRYHQGRVAEMQGLFRQAMEMAPEMSAYAVAHAAVLMETGRLDEASSIVERVASAELRGVPWPVAAPALAQLTLLCSELDDRHSAALLYPHLAPWAHLLGYSIGVSYGSMSLYTGILARLRRLYDEAERQLLQAAEVNERIEAPYFLARTHLEIARLHRECGNRDDAERHAALALDIARARGFAQVERQALDLPAAPAPS